MSTDAPEVGVEAAAVRRARIAPLLTAGKGVRAIARETGIPLSAVHRAKQQLERATAVPNPESQAAASVEPPELPPSYIVERVVDGVPHAMRCLTVNLFERRVTEMINRGLLRLDQVSDPAIVISALFADLVDDNTVAWLRRRGWQGDRGRVEEIIAVVNRTIAQLPG
jgi:hypothetical protein